MIIIHNVDTPFPTKEPTYYSIECNHSNCMAVPAENGSRVFSVVKATKGTSEGRKNSMPVDMIAKTSLVSLEESNS